MASTDMVTGPVLVDLLVSGAELVATVDDERRELSGGWVAIHDGLVHSLGDAGTSQPPRWNGRAGTATLERPRRKSGRCYARCHD